jgi:hypothetical protein
MTIDELKDLIARGAAQPGVIDALELMRLGQELDRQTRELQELYGAVWTTTVIAGSGEIAATPLTDNHAHMG